MKIIRMNNLRLIMIINLKIFIDLGLKEKEIQTKELERLQIIIIN